jgi:hypothetical protein
MSQIDDIRQYVITNYFAKARSRGERHVSVRAGNVHGDMKLANAIPAICSIKFLIEADVSEVKREGPAIGSTVVFTFDIVKSKSFDVSAAEAEL